MGSTRAMLQPMNDKTHSATASLGGGDLGNCPKRENLQKWLGEGAKGLFDSFGLKEQRSPKSLLHHPNPRLHLCNPISHHRCKPHFAPVQEASCSRVPKDLLHPLLTTFGNFHFAGYFPAPQLPKASESLLPWGSRLPGTRPAFLDQHVLNVGA